eukprot:339098_1
MIIQHLLYGWDKIYDDTHFMSYMMDVRYVRCRKFIRGDSVASFLKLMEKTINDEQKYQQFEEEYLNFRQMRQEYKRGTCKNGLNGTVIILNTPDSPWEFNKTYWDNLLCIFGENKEGLKITAQWALKLCKIPTGIECVE